MIRKNESLVKKAMSVFGTYSGSRVLGSILLLSIDIGTLKTLTLHSPLFRLNMNLFL